MLYGDILASMNSVVPRFSIVNNEDFICWLATHTASTTGTVPNPTCSVKDNLGEAVLARFYSDTGA